MSGGAAPRFKLGASGGQWLDSRPSYHSPGEIAPGTYSIGGWAGRRFGLDVVKKRQICDDRNVASNPRSSNRSLVTITTEIFRLRTKVR